MDDSDAPEGGELPDQPMDHLHEFDTEAVLPGVLAFFGKKHTLAIMYEFAFADGPLRFNELEAVLDISSTTLSDRLKELVADGYVTRTSYDEVPPRVEYEVTEKTRALAPILADLYAWAETYEAGPDAFRKEE